MSAIFITGIGSILLSGVVATMLMLSNAGAPAASSGACAFFPYEIGADPCIGTSGPRVSSPATQGPRIALVAETRAPTASRD